jgi:hypothetical protein
MKRYKTLILLSLLSFPAFASDSEVLWKQWYLLQVGGKVTGYFEEIAERRTKDKHISITQRWVEDDGGRADTYIGSVAKDNDSFEPVAFFSDRKSSSSSYKIDGRAKKGTLALTFKPEIPKGQNQKKTIPLTKGVILSNFVPFYLSKKIGKDSKVAFQAVVEDARDANFDSRIGNAEIFGVSKDIQGQTCRKVDLEFNGMQGEWWIASNGKLCELKIPTNQSVLTMTTEQDAKKLLPLK